LSQTGIDERPDFTMKTHLVSRLRVGHMSRSAWVLLLVAALLAVGAIAYLWPQTPGADGLINAGSVHEIESEGVSYLADPGIYVVTTDDGILALDDDSRHVGDRVLYCGSNDRFSSPAHGETFNREGRYLAGPATGDMGRYPVTTENDQVFVDVSAEPLLPSRSSIGGASPTPTTCSGPEDPPGFYANPGA
jgi:nitrite reductase/ring-hydroxylating ferredoxin subunit